MTDSIELRQLLGRIFWNPKIHIADVASASGQRVVYFCHFELLQSPPGGEQGRWTSKASIKDWDRVVVKVSEGITLQNIAYLQKEIELLNSLDSIHYPTLLYNNVFTHDPESDQPFKSRLFVTVEKRVEAVSLRECMRNYRDETEVLLFLEKLVSALEVMWTHPSRLVHRDIKPENILVRPNGELVIIDLGIAREEGAIGITNSHNSWGPCTFLYASPEQARNDKRNISFRSDLFSIGIVIYELATGSNPFANPEDGEDILEKIVAFNPLPLSESANYTSDFSELIASFLGKQPYQRPRRVEDIKEKIQLLKKHYLLL